MSMLGRPTSLLPYVKGPMACWSTRLSNWILRSIPVLSRPRKSSFGENRMKGPGSPVNGENAVSCPLLREQRSLIIAAVPPDWLVERGGFEPSRPFRKFPMCDFDSCPRPTLATARER